MKHFASFFFVIFLFSFSLLYCQSIGISVGYGGLNMEKVNDDLSDSQNLLTSAGINASEPEKISGGLYLEGNFKYGISNFNLGIEGDYISSSGNFSYNDFSGSFTEDYDVNTTEILGLVEILIPTNSPTIQPFIQAAGGIGIASVEHNGNFKLYSDPSNNLSVKNTVEGTYFAGRIKGGLQFVLQNVIIETAVGYRLSNAGELKGDHIENGITFKDMPVRDVNGNGIEFDFSGFLISGGISIRI